MTSNDYWAECLSNCAEELGLKISAEHLTALAKAVETGHDNYGMCFYSPPSSDRILQIEREMDVKYAALEKRFEAYRSNAETAVKEALHQSSDALVSIGEHGEVTRYGGRIERIQ